MNALLQKDMSMVDMNAMMMELGVKHVFLLIVIMDIPLIMQKRNV